MDNPQRIVLTGGPGGGKTTAAELLRREVGKEIIIVPEAATMLFTGGFPRYHSTFAIKATQKAIYHVQKNLESVQAANYPKRTLLCDRGTVDSSVYWPDGVDNFFVEMGSTLDQELDRYDIVVFFETAAVGGSSIEGGNPTRYESNAEAIEIDQKLQKVWQKHQNFYFIPHNKSFMEKIRQAHDCLKTIIPSLNGIS